MKIKVKFSSSKKAQRERAINPSFVAREEGQMANDRSMMAAESATVVPVIGARG